MTTPDLFASSATDIPLATLLEESAQARREQLARRIRAARGTVPQRAKALARVLVEGLPAEIACFFLDLPGNLIFAGGVERHTGTQAGAAPVLRQPSPAVRQRLQRLAAQTQTQGATTVQIQRATRAGAAWRAQLVAPLCDVAGANIGYLVLGRRTRDFAADDLITLAGLARHLAAALAATADPPTAPDTLPPAALHAFFQATDDAFLLLDADFTIRALNPAMHALTGWDTALIGQTCQEVIRCHDEQGIPFCGTVQCPLYGAKAASSSQPSARMPALIGGDGQTERAVTIGAVALPAPEGGAAQYALVLRASAAPSTAEQQRERFLSELAHKLRNRFNSINGFVELVATDHQHPITASQRAMLSMAHNSSLELMEYIENLLYLTRRDADQAPLLLDALAAGELLEEVEQHLALAAAAAGLQLERDALDDLPPLRCDRTRLRQAIMNLVTNAIKFTPPGGTVRLAARQAGAEMLLTVVDTGIGIAPEDLPHIFERDYASERTARLGKTGGGMGLAAARAIVEQHGGTLTCASAVDAGATFTIRLPLPAPCVSPG
jgi:signal transduction histidine kinase/PAS domain-containing protein